MKVELKTKCPNCGSSHIHTMGNDQLCLECDWLNAFELVQCGAFEEEILSLLQSGCEQPCDPAWAFVNQGCVA